MGEYGSGGRDDCTRRHCRAAATLEIEACGGDGLGVRRRRQGRGEAHLNSFKFIVQIHLNFSREASPQSLCLISSKRRGLMLVILSRFASVV
jgi:hypothetical protein